MRGLLTIMLPAAAVGLLVALFGARAGFVVNPVGVVAAALAVGLVIWILWDGVPTRQVAWPDEPVETARRSVSEWGLETLVANALRGSQHSLRELSSQLDQIAGPDRALSPELSAFIAASREGRAVPRINRRDLHTFLKEIAS